MFHYAYSHIQECCYILVGVSECWRGGKCLSPGFDFYLFRVRFCGSEGGDFEDYDVSGNVRIYWPFSLVGSRPESLSFIYRVSGFCPLRFVVLPQTLRHQGTSKRRYLPTWHRPWHPSILPATSPQDTRKLCVSRIIGVSVSLQRIKLLQSLWSDFTRDR